METHSTRLEVWYVCSSNTLTGTLVRIIGGEDSWGKDEKIALNSPNYRPCNSLWLEKG